jgi:DNA-binding transcriptional LysR family regulator
VVAEVTAPTTAGPVPLRIEVPLELPPELLPSAMARLTAAYPDVVIQMRHARSADQLTALKTGELDVALLRDRPTDARLDSVVVATEAMGVILTAERSQELAEPAGVHLRTLAHLRWVGFPRRDAPGWHDQVAATLRGHGVLDTEWVGEQDRPVTSEVKLGAASTVRAFALAARASAQALPDGLIWHPLIGVPLVRRTWAARPTQSRRRDLARLIADLDAGERSTDRPGNVI